jgi:hypothetical protein
LTVSNWNVLARRRKETRSRALVPAVIVVDPSVSKFIEH